jgi:hypothetical protein
LLERLSFPVEYAHLRTGLNEHSVPATSPRYFRNLVLEESPRILRTIGCHGVLGGE